MELFPLANGIRWNRRKKNSVKTSHFKKSSFLTVTIYGSFRKKKDRLDGIVKRKVDKPTSMEDWLQSGLPEDYVERKGDDGKKRVKKKSTKSGCTELVLISNLFNRSVSQVRWADVEERMQQKKMRDVGFVVGSTDWNRMTDPTYGESALTKTKYI